ncbi:MAG: tetratricopeptide repeat protein [Armatimonadota bacterium]|nr:tetratricopeptide repeat protein [Armatimonadota bacterium]MDR7438197.1 tetratricopeptide repeat protein [Armatimonadota bacterium]MDR7471845.1 tetratricopeptide repeat protein [Armatimonadota bacterium]MDR7508086.1 tetratricopeptide repeat protein [Armatimonadota bacterium]MDR7510338.1 tetratricopeptide repeat protein [Armatimonadota bacterium]
MTQAYPLYARAAELAEAADPDEASKLWGRAGACALEAGDADAAAACFRKAVELVSLDHLDRHGRLTRLYANLTAALYQASRIREAWDAGRQALLLAEEGGRPRAIAQALYNLGLAERYLGAFDEAAKLFREARAAYLEAGMASQAADALHNLGWVHGDRGEFDAAEAALGQAGDEKAALGEPRARIRVERARLQLLRGDWVGSLVETLEVIDTAESLTDPDTYLQALLVAADASRADDLAVALGYARMAVELAVSLGRPPALLDLLPLVVRLHAEADLTLDGRLQALAAEMYARRHGLHIPVNFSLGIGSTRRVIPHHGKEG